MEILYAFLGLLVAHWIGDSLLQSDWMALNKSKSWTALFSHVLTYTTVIGIAAWFLVPDPVKNIHMIAAFVGVNFAAHYATDFVTSRVAAKLWADNQRHDFFVVLGFDQLVHAVTLALTMSWLLV